MILSGMGALVIFDIIGIICSSYVLSYSLNSLVAIRAVLRLNSRKDAAAHESSADVA